MIRSPILLVLLCMFLFGCGKEPKSYRFPDGTTMEEQQRLVKDAMEKQKPKQPKEPIVK